MVDWDVGGRLGLSWAEIEVTGLKRGGDEGKRPRWPNITFLSFFSFFPFPFLLPKMFN
jgi:hypothetical protein